MAAYGLARTTADVDIVTSGDVQDELLAFLENEEYETLHRSTGYSNHLHPDGKRGRINVVYVAGNTRKELFAGIGSAKGPGNLEIPILRPIHLIAMKVFALKNDPSRKFRELDDIRSLLESTDVDRTEVKKFFDKHGLGGWFEEI